MGPTTVMANQDAGIYQPLDHSQQQVRLMRMQHDSKEGKIDCRLEAFSLPCGDDATASLPEYQALSYCWTTRPPTHEICLNGKAFFVRPNLYEYLKLMHSERQTGWIFIDALCINQSDAVEQSSQVALMGHVYRGAQEVVAWMGIHWATFDEKGQTITPFMSAHSEGILARLVQREESDSNLEHESSTMFPPDVNPSFANLAVRNAFMNQDFWSRLWIVQEIILARVLKLQFRRYRICAEKVYGWISEVAFGSEPDPFQSIDVALVLRAEQNRERKGKHKRFKNSILYLFANFMRLRSQMAKDKNQTMLLLSAVLATPGQECSKPYDKVFGLLGLTGSNLTIDYAIPKVDLYLRVLVEGILEYGEAEKVRRAQRVEGQTDDSDAEENSDVDSDEEEHSDSNSDKGDSNSESDEEEDSNSDSDEDGEEDGDIDIRWCYYWKSLILCFDVSPWQPVVAHTTRLALDLCEIIPAHGSYDFIVRNYARRAVRKSALTRTGFRTRTKVAAIQLRLHKGKDSFLSAPPDDARKMRVSEWTNMVQAIFRDVVEKMHTEERLDAATVARLLEQVPSS